MYFNLLRMPVCRQPTLLNSYASSLVQKGFTLLCVPRISEHIEVPHTKLVGLIIQDGKSSRYLRTVQRLATGLFYTQ